MIIVKHLTKFCSLTKIVAVFRNVIASFPGQNIPESIMRVNSGQE